MATIQFRQVVIHTGETFSVPQGIQRIDTRSTHGWQVRYQGTKMFSDNANQGGTPRKSLLAATDELSDRIANLPAPMTLQRKPSAHKASQLPSGVSGPILRMPARGKTRTASFSVLLPQYGDTARIKSIYIGSENTYNAERYHQALERALEYRREAEAAYAEAATLARRRAARGLKTAVKKANPVA